MKLVSSIATRHRSDPSDGFGEGFVLALDTRWQIRERDHRVVVFASRCHPRRPGIVDVLRSCFSAQRANQHGVREEELVGILG
ncbi:MAG: hypothetical protein Q8M22_10785, partial [Actinomycetota bacterium]|nr:hypothetical protein [Actinomycetota bacterium]